MEKQRSLERVVMLGLLTAATLAEWLLLIKIYTLGGYLYHSSHTIIHSVLLLVSQACKLLPRYFLGPLLYWFLPLLLLLLIIIIIDHSFSITWARETKH